PEQHTNAAASPLSKANWQVVLYRYGTHLAVFEFATMCDDARLCAIGHTRFCAIMCDYARRHTSHVNVIIHSLASKTKKPA
ncbi:TPA: hypothetical protein ACIGX2_004584, partial [Escherichia coli]